MTKPEVIPINTYNLVQAISERDFSLFLEDLLKQLGYTFAHFRPARTENGWRTPMSGTKGWPDYVAINPETRRMIVIECKSDKGKLTQEQEDWRRLSVLVNIPFLVLRPGMSTEDIIELIQEAK